MVVEAVAGQKEEEAGEGKQEAAAGVAQIAEGEEEDGESWSCTERTRSSTFGAEGFEAGEEAAQRTKMTAVPAGEVPKTGTAAGGDAIDGAAAEEEAGGDGSFSEIGGC